jgi:hypothetical protein
MPDQESGWLGVVAERVAPLLMRSPTCDEQFPRLPTRIGRCSSDLIPFQREGEEGTLFRSSLTVTDPQQ